MLQIQLCLHALQCSIRSWHWHWHWSWHWHPPVVLQDKRGQDVYKLFAGNRGQHKLIKFLGSFGLKVHNAQASTVCCLKLYPQDSHTHKHTHKYKHKHTHTPTLSYSHSHRLPQFVHYAWSFPYFMWDFNPCSARLRARCVRFPV